MRTIPFPVVVAALGMAYLAACGDRESAIEHDADEAPTPGGTLVMAEATDMALPMPLLIQTVIDGDLADIMFMGLFRTAWENGRAVFKTADESPMALARRYEWIGEDSASIRFHLRSDARWSDGRPVTAHDVVWTYEAMSDPDLPTPRRDYVEHLDSLVAENDSTVTFHYRRRYPEMLFHAGHGIVPRHIYQGVSLGELASHASVTDPANHLVVSGPFRIVSVGRGQRIVFEPHPHFEPRPYLDRIVIRIVPDETTRLVELQTGDIDGVRLSAPANIKMLEGHPEIRLERIGRRFSEFVAYNPAVEPFGDPEIRRALGLAIDLPTLIEALELTGYADPAASVYSPIFTDLEDPELRPLPYDPARARSILEGKGWVDSDGDGIREKDGNRFSFNLLFNSESRRRSDVATILQRYWREVGVDVQLQQQEFQSFAARLMGKDYVAAIFGWQVSLSPDVSGTWAPEAIANFVSYRRPELDELMQTALAQSSETEAVRYWKEVARMIAEDQPYTWLFYVDQVVALRRRLRGPEIDTFGLYQNVWEWWIPRAQQRETAGGADRTREAPVRSGG